MEFERKINATSLDLWGKVFDQTSSRQSFTIVISGLAKRAIGDYIEELVDEDNSHAETIANQSWWSKLLYGAYCGKLPTAIEHAESEGYSIEFEYTDAAVLVHCKVNA